MSDHPNLDAFLKDQALARSVRNLKRPESWIRYVLLAALILWPDKNISIFAKGAIVIVGMVLLGYLFQGLRTGIWRFNEQFGDSFREDEPRYLQSILRRTPNLLPKETLTYLDDAAALLRKIQQTAVEAKLLGVGGSAYADAQIDASKVALQIMNGAISVVRRAAWRKEIPSTHVLTEAADALREIAAESTRAADLVTRPDSEQELREVLAHLKAFQDAHEEVQALRL